MAENLHIPSHRTSNPKLRENWDRIFKGKGVTERWVSPSDVNKNKREGWRIVEESAMCLHINRVNGMVLMHKLAAGKDKGDSNGKQDMERCESGN